MTGLDDASENVQALAEQGEEGMMADDAKRRERVSVLDITGLFRSLLLQLLLLDVRSLLVLTFRLLRRRRLLTRTRRGRRRSCLVTRSCCRRRLLTLSTLLMRFRVLFLDRTEKVDAHAESNAGRVLLREREYETCGITVRVGALLTRTVDIGASFRLAKEGHILR